MIRHPLALALLIPTLALAACQTAPPRATQLGNAEVAALNRGYALLYSTVNDETRVDQVLLIKRPSEEVADLLREIARFASDARERLRAFAEVDATLGYDVDGLPEMETLTREAIADSTTRKIFGSSGADFEVTMLLTQHEALNYIAHLADTIGERETHQARQAYLAQLSEEARGLHERVVALLKVGRE